ncbi:MAG TPA: hypothetical protein VE714_11515, partial [Gemmatimonadales bacterium]|nr:hypothetical protein [Gemmatimonadales bacterium]
EHATLCVVHDLSADSLIELLVRHAPSQEAKNDALRQPRQAVGQGKQRRANRSADVVASLITARSIHADCSSPRSGIRHHLVVTVKHSVRSSVAPGFGEDSSSRNITSKGVPSGKGDPSGLVGNCTAKCAAPAPAGEVVSVTSGPGLGTGTVMKAGPSHTPFTLRSTFRCTRNVVFGGASCTVTSPSTENPKSSGAPATGSAVAVTLTIPVPVPETAVKSWP